MTDEEQGTIEVDGCGLAYAAQGPREAPPLLFANPLGADRSIWRFQVPAFEDRYRVVTYDPRGHGYSGVDARALTVERLADDALALMDALGVERAAFCGISMGGMTGIRLGAKAPERFSCLALCSVTAWFPDKADWLSRMKAVRDGGPAAIADGVIDTVFSQDFQKREAALVSGIRAMMAAQDRDGYNACAAAVRDMDLRGDLANVAVPTLVLHGERDDDTTPEMNRAVATSVPGAMIEALPAKHLHNVELADAFNARLAAFLKDHS